MIDAENSIYTQIATALRTAYSGILVAGTSTLTPSAFPCVSIEEADNYTFKDGLDSSLGEKHAVLMYEVNIFSNKGAGAKAECKQIRSTVDDIMSSLNFTRLSSTPIAQDDPTRYRICSRYQAVIGTDLKLYRR